jgi:hypothetical protein
MPQQTHPLGDDDQLKRLGFAYAPGGWALRRKLARAGITTVGQLEWGIADVVSRVVDWSEYPVLEAVLVLARRVGFDATVPLPFNEIGDDSPFEVLPFGRLGLAGLELRARLRARSQGTLADPLTVGDLRRVFTGKSDAFHLRRTERAMAAQVLALVVSGQLHGVIRTNETWGRVCAAPRHR